MTYVAPQEPIPADEQARIEASVIAWLVDVLREAGVK